MKTTEIDQNPERISIEVTLRSGQRACLRPLTRADSAILGAYFLGLSDATKSVYGPHPFDRATADQLCAELDSAATLRMLATVEQNAQERIVAYCIVLFGVDGATRTRYEDRAIALDQATDCTLAPSVADDHQNSGLGSLMMDHLVGVLRRCGYLRMVLMGGVMAENERAIHFYRKYDFENVGSFLTRSNNYDMIAAL